jgi:hypothetical protein
VSALSTPARLSLAEARDLTEEVKADAASLWAKLLTLYEGEAHIALGYSSWGDYYAEEFGESKRHGYRILEAARVVAELPSDQLVTESVAREIAPVLKDEGPEAVEEVWGEVVQEHGPNPTAAQVRETVQERKDPEPGVRKSNQQSRLLAGVWQQADNILMVKDSLDLEVIKTLPQEEKDQCRQSLSEARTVITRILGAL